jgi:hypothetical protein
MKRARAKSLIKMMIFSFQHREFAQTLALIRLSMVVRHLIVTFIVHIIVCCIACALRSTLTSHVMHFLKQCPCARNDTNRKQTSQHSDCQGNCCQSRGCAVSNGSDSSLLQSESHLLQLMSSYFCNIAATPRVSLYAPIADRP